MNSLRIARSWTGGHVQRRLELVEGTRDSFPTASAARTHDLRLVSEHLCLEGDGRYPRARRATFLAVPATVLVLCSIVVGGATTACRGSRPPTKDGLPAQGSFDAEVALPRQSVPTLAVGEGHACRIRRDGTVVCWGSNDYGQVRGRPGPTVGPVEVLQVEHAVEIRARWDCSCARTANGKVRCWGACGMGPHDKRVDTFAVEYRLFRADATDGFDCSGESKLTCSFRRSDGTVLPASPVEQVQPYEPGGVAVAGNIACGQWGQTVACWTQADLERRVDDESSSWRTHEVPDATEVEQLVAAPGVICMRRRASGPVCLIERGGVGPAVDDAGGAGGKFVTVVIEGGEAKDLRAGDAFCALSGSGQVSCWNGAMVRRASERARTTRPVPIVGTEAAVTVQVDGIGALVGAAGDVYWWELSGLSSASGGGRLEARQVPGLAGVQEIAVLQRTVCARTSEGEVRCWGPGDAAARSVPSVVGISVLVAARRGFCALSRDGWLYCWPPDAAVREDAIFVVRDDAKSDKIGPLGQDICVGERRERRPVLCRSDYVGEGVPRAMQDVQVPGTSVALSLAPG